MKPRDPLDTLKRNFPGLTWAKHRNCYRGKGRGLDLTLWTHLASGYAIVLLYRDTRMWEAHGEQLSRLCARTADRLWRLANACESAAEPPAKPKAAE